MAIDANRYPVPLEWAGRTIEVRVLAEVVTLGSGDAPPIRHARLSGKHQVARWVGAPRHVPRTSPTHQEGPPRFDPAFLGTVAEVDIRSLAQYEHLTEAAS